MDHSAADEYKSSLNDLNFNSKPLINMLTMLADENKKNAPLIVKTIIDHINMVSPESKLPGLYLVDSIMKNIGDEYLKIFCLHITSLFTSVFEKEFEKTKFDLVEKNEDRDTRFSSDPEFWNTMSTCWIFLPECWQVDENTRSLMFKLRQTWTDVLPNRILYNLDVSVQNLDPAWPITAKNPSKKILINPKFLDRPVEKKSGDVPTALEKEEDKIKQKQGEALKELLAKQEQLRQLVKKNVELSMKKTSTMGSSSTSSNPPKLNTFSRDPRMVKINTVSRPISSLKPNTNFVAKEKALPKSLSEMPSCISSQPAAKKLNPAKAETLSNINNSKSSVNLVEDANSYKQPFVQKDVDTLKTKNDKCASNKLKSTTICKDATDQEIKSHSIESEKDSNKAGENFDEVELNPSIAVKSFGRYPKESKATHKKKNSSSDSHKVPHMDSNMPMNINRKKTFQMKIPKKNEKSKSPLNPDSTSSVDSKINVSVEQESCPSSSKSDISKINKTGVHNDPVDSSKSAHLDFFKNSCVDHVPDSTVSDINSIAHKDEDLRIRSVSSNEELENVRVPKHEIKDSDPSSNELDKVAPPRKKIKTEDIENCNPDYRCDSPVLFGSQDQDLRKPKNAPETDVYSKDWTQYKASHPDEYNATPTKLDNFEAAKFRARRQRFSEFKYYNPFEYDKYGTSRLVRGRYVSRRAARRMHFPRGMRGSRWFYASPVGSVMFDSRAFLKQAEEKYRSGRISETEYIDLRRDLQKMAECSNLSHFPVIQANEDYERISQKLDQDYEQKDLYSDGNMKIQRPSVILPSVKPFVLDGKDRVIHFIEDKAIVLMDNNEPRELTFKDEKREVYIEGMTNPLTLSFDGKSVEFEIDGRRHIMRFGTPGRELYINNHPYEVQFGGPPIAAMLEDGHVYKIRLSGPPPQVTIGSNPQYELLAKNNMNNIPFKQEINPASERLTSETQFAIPTSSAPLQDIDMRVERENVQQADMLINKDSPFFSENMKDVDWRHIPPSNTLESEKNHTSMLNEDVPFDRWTKEETNNRPPYSENRTNQHEDSLPKESSVYEWKAPAQQKHSHFPVHTDKSSLPSSSSQDKWYCNDNNRQWLNNNNREMQHPVHLQENNRLQTPSSSTHFDFRHDHSNFQHSQRPHFQDKQKQGPNYRPWMSMPARGRQRHNTPRYFEPQTRFSTVPQRRMRPLLPPPRFPSEYPALAHVSNLPPQGDDMVPSSSAEIQYNPVPGTSVSEMLPVESGIPGLKVDVESLLEKLVAAGIINTKSEQPETESSEVSTIEADDSKENDIPTEVPEISFTTESLRTYYSGVITALYKGLQCATCGMRFKESQNDQYSNHLDWHFRMNRRERDGAKKANSRRWYYEIEDWIQFEEFEDFEERVPSYFELQANSSEPVEEEVPKVISVPATSDDEEGCPVCREKFQLFWVEEEEEWHYRNAVRHDKVTYHPGCYEDFKKASEAEKALSESNASKSSDEDEILASLLDFLLDSVCKNNETETLGVEIPSSSENDEKVPSVEVQSEEEILEGKPGEEEIIGLISESDIEMDIDVPKTESKMVVMQSNGITLKVKAESLQCQSPSNSSEKDAKVDDDEEIDFRPPTPDPNFEVRPPVSKGRELSGLCCIM